MSADTQNQWTEADSQLYQDIAPVAVPARAQQIAALLTLLPFSQSDPFHAVEMGCGQGILSQALLTCFPHATLTALDGSPKMRARTAHRLHKFGNRVSIEPFELAHTNWHTHLQNADGVLSSLVVHHLPGPAKRTLFTNIHHRLSLRGALLIADLVAPQHPKAGALFANSWDHVARLQSVAQTGSSQLFEKFKQARWNYYRYDDPADRPSPLFDQLLWLKDAGFATVDCFWMQAGHAIYGGYKTAATPLAEDELTFEETLRITGQILNDE